jgi:hypothetical protein
MRDPQYYLEKARTERELGIAIVDPDLAMFHHELARGYEALATTAEQRPKLRHIPTAADLGKPGPEAKISRGDTVGKAAIWRSLGSRKRSGTTQRPRPHRFIEKNFSD